MISDTQMSLLMGLSFALFYTVCGIPLGRLADTKSRRGLIAFGVLFWSAATAACDGVILNFMRSKACYGAPFRESDAAGLRRH